MRHIRLLSRSFSLSAVLIFSFVSLNIVSGALMLLVANNMLATNTNEDLRHRSEYITLAITERVKSYLDPIPSIAAHLTDLLALNREKADDIPSILSILSASLNAAPQISTLALVQPDLRVYRQFQNDRAGVSAVTDWSEDAEFQKMIDDVRVAGKPGWGPTFFAEAANATYLNYLYPVRRTGQTVIVSLSVRSLSHYLRELENELGGNMFILQDRDFVLAHAQLDGPYAGLSDAHPLPDVVTFEDPILSGIWSNDRHSNIERNFVNDLAARVVDLDDETYVFLYREIHGYGAVSWQVGTYFPLETLAPQIARNRVLIYLCMGLIGVSVLVALALSAVISRPFRSLATSANRIAHWQLSPDPELPPSHIREINEANRAFRGMISTVHSFERYVPRPIVRRLFGADSPQTLPAISAPVTVMFTDIIGFTSMAETMAPSAVTAMLNEHFKLVDGCIEATGGTVDKYMGDAVMAFWGGIEGDLDQAKHACRAALEIVRKVRAGNSDRIARGLPPIRMRIGIHSGPAVIGNIGAAARVNFTVIGDTVNTASRLEKVARTVGGEIEEVVVVISGETAGKLHGEFKLRHIGSRVLEGRHEATEIYVLTG